MAKGRLRLVIVVDKVNDELRRTVEFLDECTGPRFQIVCAELRYFATDTVRLLVPTLIGAPPTPPVGPGSASGRTNSAQLLATMQPAVVEFFLSVLDEATRRGHTIYWGRAGCSLRAKLPQSDKLVSSAYCWPGGRFELYTRHLLNGHRRSAPVSHGG